MDVCDRTYSKEFVKKVLFSRKKPLIVINKDNDIDQPTIGQVERETTLEMIRRYVRGIKQI